MPNPSQQAYISSDNDLVQKNRTLEHMCKKLRQELAKTESQAVRHKSQLETLQRKWLEEREEWKQGYDAVQSAHKVVQLRTAVLLDAERQAVLAERDVSRMERLARMQRDYKIVLFQMKENEMEIQLEELQDELDECKTAAHLEKQRLLSSQRQVVQNLKAQCIALDAKVKEKKVETETVESEKTTLEARSRSDFFLSLYILLPPILMHLWFFFFNSTGTSLTSTRGGEYSDYLQRLPHKHPRTEVAPIRWRQIR
jgi:hypothetical protein